MWNFIAIGKIRFTKEVVFDAVIIIIIIYILIVFVISIYWNTNYIIKTNHEA